MFGLGFFTFQDGFPLIYQDLMPLGKDRLKNRMEFEMKILDEIKKVPRETPLRDENGRPKRSLKFLFSSKKKHDSEKAFQHKYYTGRILRIDEEI